MSSSKKNTSTHVEAMKRAVTAARTSGGEALDEFEIIILRRDHLRTLFGHELFRKSKESGQPTPAGDAWGPGCVDNDGYCDIYMGGDISDS